MPVYVASMAELTPERGVQIRSVLKLAGRQRKTKSLLTVFCSVGAQVITNRLRQGKH
jgi:hypothetical protein